MFSVLSTTSRRTYFSPSTFCSQTRKRHHTILNEISGQVFSGQVMALMGPSGAGKTSLLKTLSLQNFAGSCTGSVQLDEQDITIGIFKQICAIVEQHDTLWPILTTEEHLQYAAKFIFPGQTLAENEAIIKDLLDLLDLGECGYPRASKLSGGQKRRLSLGCHCHDEGTKGIVSR